MKSLEQLNSRIVCYALLTRSSQLSELCPDKQVYTSVNLGITELYSDFLFGGF